MRARSTSVPLSSQGDLLFLKAIRALMRKEEVAVFFVIFDTKEKKDHFVASRRRWLEYQGEGSFARKRAK